MLNYLLICCLAAVWVICLTVIVRLLLGWRDKRRIANARGMFVFHDGKAYRSVDPIATWMKLEAHPKFILERHYKLSTENDTEALELLADAVREAFGVPAYTTPTKPGLAVHECRELLTAFLQYCDALKKNTNPGPTSAQSSEPTSSESDNETSSGTLGSGSVGGAELPSTDTQPETA